MAYQYFHRGKEAISYSSNRTLCSNYIENSLVQAGKLNRRWILLSFDFPSLPINNRLKKIVNHLSDFGVTDEILNFDRNKIKII